MLHNTDTANERSDCRCFIVDREHAQTGVYNAISNSGEEFYISDEKPLKNVPVLNITYNPFTIT